MIELFVLVKEFGIIEEDLEEMDFNLEDLGEDYGNLGEMFYLYYFKVFELILEYVFKDKGWKVGEIVYVFINIFDEFDYYDEIE